MVQQVKDWPLLCRSLVCCKRKGSNPGQGTPKCGKYDQKKKKKKTQKKKKKKTKKKKKKKKKKKEKEKK